MGGLDQTNNVITIENEKKCVTNTRDIKTMVVMYNQIKKLTKTSNALTRKEKIPLEP